ncbi:MAG TPA: class I SAM-dependent methyltransferase [Miltoncostaeaceae bacterium]|nr:class I SAM-dependent methyltransferase [Miltoncostaeaceae bacterium]
MPAGPVGEADPYTALAAVYDDIVVDRCHARWSRFLHERWSADPDGVRSVLDVCCGTGLMTAELAALGYRVVGVDASAAMLDRARLLLGPRAALVRQTLPDLTIGGTFDAAVSTLDGFNHLTPDAFRATLVALAARIRPGGWLVFDVHTDAMMDLMVANPLLEGEEDGHRFTLTSTVDTRARTCDTRIRVAGEGAERFTERHRQWFFPDWDIRAGLAAAGFTRITVTDEYADRPVDASSLRATWVARRDAGPAGITQEEMTCS